MRITDIYIKNYRAFYGEYHITLDKGGKNLMVYGENGSGKSSLFTALQSFFKASIGKVEVEENIFIPVSQKNTASIRIKIRENADATVTQEFEVDTVNKEIISGDKSLIANANKVKGFFDYRSLLKTHIDHDSNVNLFKILVKEILYHSINRFSTEEIGREWDNIYNDIYNKKQTKKQQNAIRDYLKNKFNPGLKILLADIEKDVNTFMSYFGNNIIIKLNFDKVEYTGRRGIIGNNIDLEIEFVKKHIPKHQFFLNEARLSALAISVYLASIKVNPLTGALKILVLDDLLIGLDMSNRLPLLSILKNHFIDIKQSEQFQIVMTTYDKVWFDLVSNYFGSEKWNYIEIYSKKLIDEDFEFPIIKNTLGYIEKAKYYLLEKDNKASAVYIRTEFERIVMNICEKKVLQVSYKIRQKDFKTEDFWEAITKQTDLDPALVKEIETHRSTVMNPFSHYDLEKPEFEKELTNTIVAIEKLKNINIKDLNKITIDDLKKKAEDLEKKLIAKQIVTDRLRDIIKKKP
ncbi:AAA family ATPase [Mucilaginibacter gilvus]|uniref:ATP-binding cassette domain-containing protein n=1 Tax=Mucilaginibacter gilvus TaxID=2305909 RepID=A0A3S3V7H3_9SPHI|nr:AAA family ATPase [Mucilaginibacter gilvus]RWY57532.1 ATP-binding cassette domain-containing protein [Mucilaginibacter gilvus]